MPERVTKEERIISLAIEKARKAKEELSAKQRKNIEPTQVLEIDTDPEVEKIKRPKVQDASKITNQTQKKEGYGLAGESLKKQDEGGLQLVGKSLIGKTFSMDKLTETLANRFGDVKQESSSSSNPSFIADAKLQIIAKSADGSSERYIIEKIKVIPPTSPRLKKDRVGPITK